LRSSFFKQEKFHVFVAVLFEQELELHLLQKGGKKWLRMIAVVQGTIASSRWGLKSFQGFE
jgi:hypothetical protein